MLTDFDKEAAERTITDLQNEVEMLKENLEVLDTQNQQAIAQVCFRYRKLKV